MMDSARIGTNIRLKGWWCGRFWYIPIGLLILGAYCLGFYLTFYLYFNENLHNSSMFYSNTEARFYLHLYGAGVLGGALHCNYLFARDANEKIYTGAKLPTVFDILGYFIYIVGSGITGLAFYFLIIGGVVVVAANGTSLELKPVVAGLLAFAGGYSTDGVKSFVRFWFGKIVGDYKK